jgi:S-adenosylmethionine synthetase
MVDDDLLSFYRCELRVLQMRNDNETFLKIAAKLISDLTNERDDLKYKVGMLEHEVSILNHTNSDW